jgi:hypothetical protein
MKRLLAPLLFSLIVSAPAPAAAEGPAKPAADAERKTLQRLRLLFEEAQRLADAGRCKEALPKLREVVAIRSHPTSLLSLARCEDQLGDLLKARAACKQALDDARAGKLDDDAQDATKALAELEPRIPRILVEADLPAHLLRVELDTVSVTLRKGRLETNPGKHAVVVKAPGRMGYQTEVELAPGEEKVVRPLLPPAPLVGKGMVSRAALAVGGGGLGLVALGAIGLGVGAGKPSGKGLAAAGGVVLGTGVVAFGTGIGLGVHDLRAPAGSAAARSPIIAAAPLPGGAWVGLGMAF